MRIKINSSNGAFGLMELLVVIVVGFILFLLLLPGVSKDRRRREFAVCANNLKQVGLAFTTWSEDNGKNYPMHFRTNGFDGESLANSRAMSGYFQIMSNELGTPKLLVCPADKKRRTATDFGTNFNSGTISYFVGLDADTLLPESFLAGDRNLTNGSVSRNGIVEFTTNSLAGWTYDVHERQGYILMGDGSIQKCSESRVRAALHKTGLQTNRFVFPSM